MSKPRWSVAAVMTLGLAAGVANAGQPWKGVAIMPASMATSIQADDGSPVSMYDITWPATVTRTRGRSAWVQDDGGASASQAGGWIYCDDAVRLESARDHYSSQLRKNSVRGNDAAWLYWMRGICWENSGDAGVAIVDYRNALRAEPRTGIDDIYIRLGRLISQQQLLKGRGYYNPKTRETWESFFNRAQQINPNRPRLFYEWGFALSQACACTQIKSIDGARKGPEPKEQSQSSDRGPQQNGEPIAENLPVGRSPSKPFAVVSLVGLDTSDDTRSTTQPANPANSLRGLRPAGKSLESLPAVAPQPATTSPSPAAVVAAPSGTEPSGPSSEGAAAAVEAVCKYQEAERLSPNWWQIPLARAELMLNQCDAESSHGDRMLIPKVDPVFLNQMLANHRVWLARQTDPSMAAPISAVPVSADAGRGDQAMAATAAARKHPTVDVVAIAIDDFDRAISLNPNALDAYRDRAEALRLANRMDEAQQSAAMACNLCYYRQWRSLRTLAQVCNDSGQYELAADYALRAAQLTSGQERDRFLYLWANYGARATGPTELLAASAAEKAGYVASTRGLDDDHAKAPARIEPPPGFVSLTGMASPD
ncbi:MAG TPA: hypothetical protein VHX65_02185 [Pirellulales bacterium]|jgi:tetratricopeptide (TPR) repeat protein|nr:hypothetical protein [Pirellulales bacterium]